MEGRRREIWNGIFEPVRVVPWSSVDHDLFQTTGGEPPKRAQEHGPKERSRQTAVAAQRPEARIYGRERDRAAGISGGVSRLGRSDRFGIPTADAGRAGARASARIRLLAPSTGELD